jgi:hypothetical protein
MKRAGPEFSILSFDKKPRTIIAGDFSPRFRKGKCLFDMIMKEGIPSWLAE